MLNSKLSAYLVCLALGLTVLYISFSSAIENRDVFVSIDDLIHELDGQWEKAFAYVRVHARYEPSPFFLKSSQGGTGGSRGNYKEQALLLNDIFQGLREETRLVSGICQRFRLCLRHYTESLPEPV